MGSMADPVRPITTYRLTHHARLEMARRQISEEDVARVLATPEQTESIRIGRILYQLRMEWGEPVKTYVLRVVVDIDREPFEVVTAYRSSKIEKYWRGIT